MNINQHRVNGNANMTILNSELKSLLNDLTTPERAGLMGEIADFLTGLGDAKHELVIESVMSRFDNENLSVSLADIEMGLRGSLDDILCSHGVLLSDFELGAMFNIVETLYGIPNYGDPRALLDVIEDDSQTPEAMLSELSSFFIGNYSDDVLATIVEVKDALIEKIKEVLYSNLESSDEGNSDLERITQIRNRFKIRFGDDTAPLLVKDLINSGYGIGLPLDAYLEGCEDKLTTLSAESIAKELSAMALLSDTEEDSLVGIIGEHLQSYISDSESIVKANAIVGQYIH